MGTDRDPVSTCKERCFVVPGFVSCIKYMEPLSFNSPAETDVVRRFPTSAGTLRICILQID